MNFPLRTLLDFVGRAWPYVLGAGAYFFSSYPRYYHRGDQSHYYMGAKYFREMSYGDLYKYSVIAEDELGTVSSDDEGAGFEGKLDLTRESAARAGRFATWTVTTS